MDKKIEVTNDFIDVYFAFEDFLPHQMVARTRDLFRLRLDVSLFIAKR